MEILDHLKENASDFKQNAQLYIDTSLDYYKLKALKASVEATSMTTRYAIAAFLIGAVTLFFSLAAALGIGEWLGKIWLGFAVIGAFYAVLAAVVFTLRKSLIERFVFKKFVQIFYPNPDEPAI